MRITLEPHPGCDIKVTIDPTEDRKFFLELLLPSYKKDVLGEHEHPYKIPPPPGVTVDPESHQVQI